MKHAIECIGFKPMKKNTLKGFVDVSIPALNLIIRNISLHERNGGPARRSVAGENFARRPGDRARRALGLHLPGSGASTSARRARIAAPRGPVARRS